MDRPASTLVVAVFTAMLFASASSCAGRPQRGPPDTSGAAIARVTRVTDGDTVHVLLAGRDERIRFIGVDTPEVPWYGGQGQCFGVQAGLYTRSRLAGRVVRLSFDVARRDRYGRMLAYMYLGDELVNLTLVRLGYARADPVPPDTRMEQIFAAAEDAARLARRGLWSACPGRR